jgi:PAS domain S-box-containing protein
MGRGAESSDSRAPDRKNCTGGVACQPAAALLPGLKGAVSDFFNSNFLGISVASLNKVVEANDAFLLMTGYDREDLAAGLLDWREMTPPEYQHFDNDSLKQMLAKGECAPFEKEYFRKDGTRLPVLVGKRLLSRDPLTWASFAMDLTARRNAEQGLKRAREQAELYLDVMGHDINNLNQIALGYLELAGETAGLSEEGRMFMDKSVETLKRSSRLIDNVKKLQKARNGNAVPVMIDVAYTVREVSKAYCTPGKVEVHTNVRDRDRFYVKADDLLPEVFSNLVDNAIKHSLSQKPCVAVIVNRIGRSGRSYYKIDVEDDGPGIPDELKEVIFNRHLRSSKYSKGSGIGLFLVKTLVRSYGGQVWVEDREPGDRSKGARFVVLLPAAEIADSKQ